MIADQPVIVYSKEEKPTKKKMDDAYARWKERKDKESESLVGKKVSLSDFLK